MRPEHWLFTILLRLRSLFRGAQAEQELDNELRDHLERKTEEYVAQGMTEEEAHRRARLDLDGIEQTKEKCRGARRVNWIQDLFQDLRFGLRMLRKSPRVHLRGSPDPLPRHRRKHCHLQRCEWCSSQALALSRVGSPSRSYARPQSWK